MSTATTLARDEQFFTRDKLFIGGEWRTPATQNRISIVSPATGQVIGSVPEASKLDADMAIAAAAEAFRSSPWRELSYVERAEAMGRVADELDKRADEIAQIFVHDFGGTVRMAQRIAAIGAAQFREHLEYAKRLSNEPERVKVGNLEALLVQEPVGPVLGIVPWNSTFLISILKLAPALLTGCPIVIKIAVESPLGAFTLGDALEAAGIPPGLVSFLPGPREALGDLTSRPEFEYISFTGSTPAGVQVMKEAAENVAAVTLELGGKSAAIILDDLDPEQHAPMLYAGTMGQSGQICTTYSRLLVPRQSEAAWREALSRFYSSLIIGDPADPATDIGPLVTAAHRARVEEYIEIARNEGATILTGGSRPDGLDAGYFLEPTLIADVTNDMRIVREEVFGPVITLQSYETEEEAIDLANSSDFGLAAGIFTLDEQRALPIALKLRAGNISVNGSGGSFLLPFGGFKKSGIGREGGFAGVEELLEWKQVQLRRA